MKLKNRKSIIFIIALIFLLVILGIIVNYKNIGYIYNTYIRNLRNQNEQDLISMDLEIKSTQDNVSKCLLTFTSKDENEKIKSIKFPEEQNNTIVVNDEEGKQKIVIDYDIEKGKEDSRFKITTTTGKEIEKRTGYTITYNVNGEDVQINNTTETALIKTNATLNERPTREGYTFYGWSKNENSKVSEYEDKYKYRENDEDITLYAVWRKNADNIVADSLIEAAEKIPETCQVSLNINNTNYDADVIVNNGDLVLDGNTEVQGAVRNQNTYEFGDKFKDVAKKDEYAENMVILKVNGNLIINQNINLTACASEYGYGGPKGLFIYCTGTLTNNGTISMTARGAYAEGQDIYLFKKSDENYEYVPSIGCDGATSVSGRLSGDGAHVNGNNGQSAENNSRKTGGGGSGKSFSYTQYSDGTIVSGIGSNGTSYSGGTGGGSNLLTVARRSYYTNLNASQNGGSGGISTSGGNDYLANGGVGNPGGIFISKRSYSGEEKYFSQAKGNNGTGGLLIISANSIDNKGKIESNGIGNTMHNAGGASGGGSINIFYKDNFTNEVPGNITAKGGISTNNSKYGKAGDGGNGSVTIENITSEEFETIN